MPKGTGGWAREPELGESRVVSSGLISKPWELVCFAAGGGGQRRGMMRMERREIQEDILETEGHVGQGGESPWPLRGRQ